MWSVDFSEKMFSPLAENGQSVGGPEGTNVRKRISWESQKTDIKNRGKKIKQKNGISNELRAEVRRNKEVEIYRV